MKRPLSLLLFVLSLFSWSAALSAQELTTAMASSLKQRTLDVYARVQETKGFVGDPDRNQMTSGEVRVVDEILPAIENLLLDAGDLFGKAAELLPGKEGRECLKKGCSKLKEALKLVKEARKLVRKDGVLRLYAEMFEEIQGDIKSAQEDAGCRHAGHNPWAGKTFRSQYNSPHGSWISGTTTIDGESGSYRTDGGQSGTFYQVTYRDNDQTAEGYWRFNSNGSKGWFAFTLNGDGQSFNGSWGNGDRIGQQRQGSWNGSI